MTDLRTAAQQALEALEGLSEPYYVLKAQDALRAALAQPEQEPVILHRELVEIHPDGTETWSETPLYTHPPRSEWQGLTEEEREQATGWSVEHIEAALKERNA